jgi:hypothetical protein
MTGPHFHNTSSSKRMTGPQLVIVGQITMALMSMVLLTTQNLPPWKQVQQWVVHNLYTSCLMTVGADACDRKLWLIRVTLAITWSAGSLLLLCLLACLTGRVYSRRSPSRQLMAQTASCSLACLVGAVLTALFVVAAADYISPYWTS